MSRATKNILRYLKYQWRDEFTTALAAGSINGTRCEPGPGFRTIVDTETALSIVPKVGTALATHAGVSFGGSNNRCSYADGYAWMDFPTGFNASLHAAQGRIVIMFDSAGVGAWGYLGAAGSGETVGNEKLSNPSFDSNTTGWTGVDSLLASIAGGQANNCLELTKNGTANPQYARTLFTTEVSALYVSSFYVKSGSSGNESCSVDIFTGTAPYTALNQRLAVSSANWAYYSTYFVAITTTTFCTLNKRSPTAGTMLFDTALVKKVLTPSATGALIYRDASLTVNGWNKPTTFNPNSASYTFGIYEPQSRGRMFFMGGKVTPAYGDPGYWKTEAITRKRGLIVAWKLNITDVTKAIELGLDTDKTGEIAGQRFRVTTDTITCYDGTTAGPVIAVPVDATDIYLVINLRDAGAHFLTKFGTANWKYRWRTITNNTTTLYAGIANYGAVGYAEFMRQVNYLWMPTPLLSDSFAGSDGSADGRLSNGLGHAETTGLGSGGAGVAWSGATGSIASNRLVITPTLGVELNSGDIVVGNWYSITATQANFFYTGCAIGNTFRCTTAKTLSADNKVKLIDLASCYSFVTLGVKDVEIRAKFTMATGVQAAIIIGMNSAGTSFIILRHKGDGNVTLEICEVGAYTTKSTTAISYSADTEIVIRRDDVTLACYYNNTLVGAAYPTTTLSAGENSNLAGLRVGVFSTDPGNSFSSFVAHYSGTNNEFSILDRLVGA